MLFLSSRIFFCYFFEKESLRETEILGIHEETVYCFTNFPLSNQSSDSPKLLHVRKRQYEPIKRIVYVFNKSDSYEGCGLYFLTIISTTRVNILLYLRIDWALYR